MLNAFPNFAKDNRHDVDMTPRQMDSLLSFQLVCPDPRYLEPQALAVAGVVDNDSLGKKLFEACVKHGYIIPRPAGGVSASAAAKDSQITVNTARMDKHLPNRLAMVSVHAQRKLVSLLFFWEEECMRWQALDHEERVILERLQVADAEQATELRTLLEGVRRRRNSLPSQRAEGAGGVIPLKDEELPVYVGRGGQ
jgi:hypothetical protein